MLIDEFLTDGLDKSHSFQYTNYNNKNLVVEGIKDLLLSSDNEIIIKISKGEIAVKGEQLKIKELSKTIIWISGKINLITSN